MNKQQLLEEIERRQNHFSERAKSQLGFRAGEQIDIEKCWFAVDVLESLKDWIKNGQDEP